MVQLRNGSSVDLDKLKKDLTSMYRQQHAVELYQAPNQNQQSWDETISGRKNTVLTPGMFLQGDPIYVAADKIARLKNREADDAENRMAFASMGTQQLHQSARKEYTADDIINMVGMAGVRNVMRAGIIDKLDRGEPVDIMLPLTKGQKEVNAWYDTIMGTRPKRGGIFDDRPEPEAAPTWNEQRQAEQDQETEAKAAEGQRQATLRQQIDGWYKNQNETINAPDDLAADEYYNPMKSLGAIKEGFNNNLSNAEMARLEQMRLEDPMIEYKEEKYKLGGKYGRYT
jgi:hypothetical protein